jgi:hypothetical protein
MILLFLTFIMDITIMNLFKLFANFEDIYATD